MQLEDDPQMEAARHVEPLGIQQLRQLSQRWQAELGYHSPSVTEQLGWLDNISLSKDELIQFLSSKLGNSENNKVKRLVSLYACHAHYLDRSLVELITRYGSSTEVINWLKYRCDHDETQQFLSLIFSADMNPVLLEHRVWASIQHQLSPQQKNEVTEHFSRYREQAISFLDIQSVFNAHIVWGIHFPEIELVANYSQDFFANGYADMRLLPGLLAFRPDLREQIVDDLIDECERRTSPAIHLANLELCTPKQRGRIYNLLIKQVRSVDYTMATIALPLLLQLIAYPLEPAPNDAQEILRMLFENPRNNESYKSFLLRQYFIGDTHFFREHLSWQHFVEVLAVVQDKPSEIEALFANIRQFNIAISDFILLIDGKVTPGVDLSLTLDKQERHNLFVRGLYYLDDFVLDRTDVLRAQLANFELTELTTIVINLVTISKFSTVKALLFTLPNWVQMHLGFELQKELNKDTVRQIFDDQSTISTYTVASTEVPRGEELSYQPVCMAERALCFYIEESIQAIYRVTDVLQEDEFDDAELRHRVLRAEFETMRRKPLLELHRLLRTYIVHAAKSEIRHATIPRKPSLTSMTPTSTELTEYLSTCANVFINDRCFKPQYVFMSGERSYSFGGKTWSDIAAHGATMWRHVEAAQTDPQLLTTDIDTALGLRHNAKDHTFFDKDPQPDTQPTITLPVLNVVFSTASDFNAAGDNEIPAVMLSRATHRLMEYGKQTGMLSRQDALKYRYALRNALAYSEVRRAVQARQAPQTETKQPQSA